MHFQAMYSRTLGAAELPFPILSFPHFLNRRKNERGGDINEKWLGREEQKMGMWEKAREERLLSLKDCRCFFPSLLLGKGLKGEDKGAKIGKERLIVSLPFRLGPYVAAKYTGKFWRFAFNIFFPF